MNYGYQFAKILEHKVHCDFVLPLGKDCRPASYLKRFGLRFFSSPFDYMCNYSQDIVTKLIENNNNFFVNYKELVEIKGGIIRDNDSNYNINTLCHVVKDIDTNMISLHHFPLTKTVDSYISEFHKLMNHRFERIRKYLSLSDKICLIMNRELNEDRLMTFTKWFNNKYKKDVILINIYNRKTTYPYFVVAKQPQITLYNFYFHDVHPDGNRDDNPNKWLGNTKFWNEIMRMFILNKKIL